MPANDGTAMKQFKRYMTVRLFNPRRSALVLQMRPWLPRSHRRLPEERGGSVFACNACLWRRGRYSHGLCDCLCCHCTSGCGKRWWWRVRPFEDICLRKLFLGVRHGALEHLDQDLRSAYEFDNSFLTPDFVRTMSPVSNVAAAVPSGRVARLCSELPVALAPAAGLCCCSAGFSCSGFSCSRFSCSRTCTS